MASDPDVFVESIPFLETRGYVKKVLRNYEEYKRIYGRTSGVSLPPPPAPGAAAVQAGTRLCKTTAERCP